ncbi:integrase [Salmonella enterica subsp. enterica serovar Senftenberg]|uniref:site-specific integrase n=1 Tax=Enterobacteriaceae TaxID=543 RepID=UPI00073707E8|nr:site-specific integrase [Salmonella enterica]EDD0650869.1 integrase [Salmonella enterica subsp. enterica serovar Westhampton]EKW3844787.1 site-specific integrase [Citrobacter amalonaticus]OQD47423.1 hypothetical protein BWZ29_20310 [Enterobacter cancerogenus]EAB4350043.1 integrase [Salmonella enterica]EAF5631343.1 integrase [Salmonella enterica subsp. enterica serovar Senftenberg]
MTLISQKNSSLQPQIPDDTVISRIFINGKWVTLSIYINDEWIFNDAPTNTCKSRRHIRFTAIPVSFRPTLKYISWHWLSHGRPGKIKPRPGTIIAFISEITGFLNWLTFQNIHTLNKITVEHCLAWARYLQQYKRINTDEPLKPATLSRRLAAVETLFELGQFCPDKMIPHPWPGTSSHRLARMNDLAMQKTPLMPDSVFTTLFQHAWHRVTQASELLQHRDALQQISKNVAHKSPSTRSLARSNCLITRGWKSGPKALYEALTYLSTACYIIIASLSGCRNHELAWLKTGACYKVRHENGEILWWMRSRSTKTGEGQTEWMIPPAAVKAIRVAEKLALPLHKELETEIQRKKLINPYDPEIQEAERHLKVLFPGKHPHTGVVRTLNGGQWNLRLRSFCKYHGITWAISTHQFRRKFANYAAQSQFGDLRYLREHFKHWSVDMTLRYAVNASQEMTLLSEIKEDVAIIKTTLIDKWLQSETPLAGGYGESLKHWRKTDASHIFHSHEHMLRSIAESIAIRSNGHAWCTADNRKCSGNFSQNMLRCSECQNAVIDSANLSVYQKLYEDLKILQRSIKNQSSQKRISSDITHCKRVMLSFGINLNNGDTDEPQT